MTSITREVELEAAPEIAWQMLRDVGAAKDAFPGVLVDSHLHGDVRTVTFANGMVAKERILDIDDTRRRLAYAVVEGRFSHHGASLEVRPRGAGGSLVVWTSDFLPADAEAVVRPLMEQGLAALARAAGARR